MVNMAIAAGDFLAEGFLVGRFVAIVSGCLSSGMSHYDLSVRTWFQQNFRQVNQFADLLFNVRMLLCLYSRLFSNMAELAQSLVASSGS